MKCNITARRITLNSKEKEYLKKRISKLDKVHRHIVGCDVIAGEEKFRKSIEIILRLKNNKLMVRETAQDFYALIDNAVENLKRQLKKNTDKLKSRRRRVMFSRIKRKMMPEFGVKQKEKKPKIVRTKFIVKKPMSVEEAALELKILSKDFFVFNNSQTDQINVMYKRKDGNFGLIEP